jgi:ElaB/YqjD/DUF883 family membrane-anchored ribosome-binding protein
MTNSEYEKEIANLKQELKDIKEVIESKAEKYTQKGESFLGFDSFSLEEIQNKAKKAGKTFGAFLKDRQKHLRQAKRNCEDYVEEHPATSCAYSFVTGVVAALILKNILRK